MLKLNVKSLTLTTGQVTGAVRVTVASGDRVVSWKSSRPSIAAVSMKGKIRAGKKNGCAVLTVKLRSGKTAKLKVKVQKGRAAVRSSGKKILQVTVRISD